MNSAFEVSINLSVLPLPLRNKYMLAIRKLNIRYGLENQLLTIFEKDLFNLVSEVKKNQ